MIEQSHLSSIVSSVWSTIFGVEPEAADPAGAAREATGVVARISITGEHGCTVTIACSESLARRIAAEMLAVRADSLSAADVSDALGEVANMAAGNLKALLPPGHHLTLPEVAVGAASVSWDGADDLRGRCAFQSDAGLFVASIHGAATEAVA